YHELARQRAAQAPYRDRRIRFLIAHDPDLSRFVIRDEGCGFDTSRAHRPIEPEDLLRPSGRGLLLMKSFMDSVTFNQAGNEVTLVKRKTTDFPLAKPLGMIEDAPAAISGPLFRPFPGQGKTDSPIKRTASCLNGKLMPQAPHPAASN